MSKHYFTTTNKYGHPVLEIFFGILVQQNNSHLPVNKTTAIPLLTIYFHVENVK